MKFLPTHLVLPLVLILARQTEQAAIENIQNNSSTADPAPDMLPEITDIFWGSLPLGEQKKMPSATTIATTTTTTTTTTPASSDHAVQQCIKFPTDRLRASCENIERNSPVAKMEEVHGFVDAVDRKKFKRKNPGMGRAFAILRPGFLNCDTKCPSGEEWSKATQVNERSFSPWLNCQHYDPDRYPQFLQVAKCQCRGCMDPGTNKENINYFSVAVPTQITVLRKDVNVATFAECDDKTCREGSFELTIGCHCVRPEIFT